ncbi:MAG: type II toxin-antitoxin system prevent-host-death family antitoxin [Cryobacterium sp.]
MGYSFDSDQLPELPDPGPRDGRHGVDRDEGYDPFPPRRRAEGDTGTLTVSVEAATGHLAVLLRRVEDGEEVVLTRAGRPVARLVGPEPAGAVMVSETVVSETIVTVVTEAPGGKTPRLWKTARTGPRRDDSHQLPALPDPGPRDGRHGVDSDRGYPFGG